MRYVVDMKARARSRFIYADAVCLRALSAQLVGCGANKFTTVTDARDARIDRVIKLSS